MDLLRDPSFLPSCILAGVGIVFLVLAFTLPPAQVVGLVAGTALVVGLALARLRRRRAGAADGPSALRADRAEPRASGDDGRRVAPPVPPRRQQARRQGGRQRCGPVPRAGPGPRAYGAIRPRRRPTRRRPDSVPERCRSFVHHLPPRRIARRPQKLRGTLSRIRKIARGIGRCR